MNPSGSKETRPTVPATRQTGPFGPQLLSLPLLAGWIALATIPPAKAGDFIETLAPSVPAPSPWEFDFTLKGWGPAVDLTTPGGVDVDISLGDIFDALNMTAQFEFELRRGKWALTADAIYVDLDFELDGRILRDLQVEEWIVTPKLSYRAWEGDWGWFDFQAGFRYTWADVQVRAAALGFPIVESGSGEIWDACVGFRGRYNLNECWFIDYYAEAGTGDSDFVGELFGSVGYRLESMELFAGFRYITYDFSNGAPLKDETAYGPILGLRFKF